MKNAPDIINKVFNIFSDYEIYLVGGSVRDMLMDKEAKDFDFAINIIPDGVVTHLKSRKIKTYQVGKHFGTIDFVLDNVKCEITTFRSEEYESKSRKPIVEFITDIKEDLRRRDFTMNSLALDRKGNVIDYFNGVNDIKNKLIRIIGYEKVFKEDPLRMLRAIRFQSQLGFSIVKETIEKIKSEACSILNVSRERWQDEVNKLLCGEYVDIALQTFIDSGLINFMMPEILQMINLKQPPEHHHKDVWNHTKLVVANLPKDVVLRWAGLLHDIGKPFTRTVEKNKIHFYKHELVSELVSDAILYRFKFSNKDRKKILNLIKNHMRIVQYDSKWSDTALRKLKKDVNEECINDLIELSRADITTARPDKIKNSLLCLDEMSKRIKKLEEKNELIINLPKNIGYDIMKEFDLEEGKHIGILKSILEDKISIGALLSNQKSQVYIKFLKEHYPDISDANFTI